MFYVKAQINDEIEIRVPLYGDQIFCGCPACGKEVQVDEESLYHVLEDGDLAGSAIYCKECGEKIRVQNSGNLKEE